MITFLIFILLTAIEFSIVAFKWSDLNSLHTIGKVAAHVTGVEDHFNAIVEKIVLFLMKFKTILWLLVIVASIINFIIAYLTSILIHIILSCLHLIF